MLYACLECILFCLCMSMQMGVMSTFICMFSVCECAL